MFRILFLCTGNSGRSSMAAAFARKMAPKRVEILCAGDRHHAVHPHALQVMEETDTPLDSAEVMPLNRIAADPLDVVVTLCNQALEICPVLPGSPARIHWPLPDPKKPERGSKTATLDDFRRVRDEILQRVKGLFQFGFLDSILRVRLTFSSLLDNLTDGVMAHDLDRRIYYFNSAAQKITGFSYSEVIGRDCHDVFPGRFCGGDCSFCLDKVNIFTRTRYPQTFLRRDQQRRELEMSVVPIHTPNHDVIGALIIFRDMTEVLQIRRKLTASRGFQGIIGRHPSMLKVFESIQELADVKAPILIQGESGTGKELVAMALHNLSSRAAGPFVPVNCGALPEGTLESELFGHVRGAFTGAVRDKKGRFELAEGGTIFLDEIGEISPSLQVKLLRVLQDKTFVPVGGEKTVHADVRVICATNRDLKLLTRQGFFREDLYYRLAVVPLYLPALRDKASDIPLLVEHFLDKFSAESGKTFREVTPAALEKLMKYRWPGNVRELSNAVQYGMIKCRGDILDVQHLPEEILQEADAVPLNPRGRRAKLDSSNLEEALRKTGNNRSEAARLLGVSRTTLYRHLGK
jgi:PAS domain S-box-containing protein